MWLLRTIVCFGLVCSSHKIGEGVSAGEETPSPALSTCGSDEQASRTSEMQQPPSLSSVPSPSQLTPAGEGDRSHRSRSPRERGLPDQTTSVTRKRAGAPELEDRCPSGRQEPPSKPESEMDECYHFALSLVPLLHRLDQNNRHHAKIGILDLLSVKQQVQLTNNWSCSTPATVPPPRPNTHPPHQWNHLAYSTNCWLQMWIQSGRRAAPPSERWLSH